MRRQHARRAGDLSRHGLSGAHRPRGSHERPLLNGSVDEASWHFLLKLGFTPTGLRTEHGTETRYSRGSARWNAGADRERASGGQEQDDSLTRSHVRQRDRRRGGIYGARWHLRRHAGTSIASAASIARPCQIGAERLVSRVGPDRRGRGDHQPSCELQKVDGESARLGVCRQGEAPSWGGLDCGLRPHRITIRLRRKSALTQAQRRWARMVV